MDIVSDRVLILARTQMNNHHVCIGGYAHDSKRYIRLLTKCAENQSEDSRYQVGEIYKITYTNRQDIILPHCEDVCVLKSDFLENLERARLNNVLSKICKNNNIHIKDLFNGLLSWENDKGFLKKTGNLPQQSVMVVTLSHDLFLSKIQTDEKTRFYYKDNGFGKTFTVPYVGVTNIGPLKRIAQGRFLRFSLARWWNPDSSFPEDRAYLQLSAIY